MQAEKSTQGVRSVGCTAEVAAVVADIGSGSPSFSVGCKPKPIRTHVYSEDSVLGLSAGSSGPRNSVAFQIEGAPDSAFGLSVTTRLDRITGQLITIEISDSAIQEMRTLAREHPSAEINDIVISYNGKTASFTLEDFLNRIGLEGQ